MKLKNIKSKNTEPENNDAKEILKSQEYFNILEKYDEELYELSTPL